jgi:hypothetical protein
MPSAGQVAVRDWARARREHSTVKRTPKGRPRLISHKRKRHRRRGRGAARWTGRQRHARRGVVASRDGRSAVLAPVVTLVPAFGALVPCTSVVSCGSNGALSLVVRACRSTARRQRQEDGQGQCGDQIVIARGAIAIGNGDGLARKGSRRRTHPQG